MTRYTKLDMRKAPHKATQYFDDDKDDAAAASSSVAAVATPVEEVAATSSSPSTSSKKRKVSAEDDNDAAGAEVAPAAASTSDESSANDPHRLQKRLKLLRLKAKTAKTDDKRTKLRTEIKAVEAQIKEENGKRGGGAPSTTSGGSKKPAKPAAPVVTETNPWKKMEAERRLKSSARNEERREKRAEERAASTRCFACRGMGHAARDCTMGLNAAGTALEGEEGQQGASGSAATLGDEAAATAARAAENKAANLTGKETVGICFRCGSTQHILSRCRRPTPRTGPTLPFATCFVCGQKGHLSSTCSQNAGKGVYPNGGCCKLCQSVEHLAKDCPLRRSEATQASNATMWGGQGSGWAGARGGDDDDFHAFARKKAEVEREEKLGGGGAAAGGGHGAKAPGAAPRKKVVSF